MRKLIWVVISLLFMLTACSKGNEKLKVPATYHPDTGIYTVNSLIGTQKISTDLILDTGSANLILVGDKKLCPDCTTLGSYSRYTPSPLALSSHVTEQAKYGSTGGDYNVYADIVSISKDQQAPYVFSVFTKGKDVSNIMGLAYQRIAFPDKQPLLPYFDFIVQKQNLPNEFSLLFCGDDGQSYFYIGSPKISKPQSVKKIPIINKSYYVVLLKQIGTKDDKQLVTFENDYDHQATVIDSGLGGFIGLPQKATDAIINYLYQHTSDENRQLPKSFWEKNYCVYTTKIDFSKFPDLVFNFVDPKHPDKLIPLTIPPKKYISNGGCGTGMSRLSFMPTPDLPKLDDIPDHKQDLLDVMPNKVVGTPLLENYLVTFKRSDPAELVFSSNNLCQTKEK